MIDGHGVGVDAGIAAGDGLGAEAVSHPSSTSMTTNVAAQVMEGLVMSQFYQTRRAQRGANSLPASRPGMAFTQCRQGEHAG